MPPLDSSGEDLHNGLSWHAVMTCSPFQQTRGTHQAACRTAMDPHTARPSRPAPGILLGAAGRDCRGQEVVEPTMPQRLKVPKPPDRLLLGGEPTGVLHTGEIVSRLERNRRTKGHCRPQHRLESGAISALQNVKSDLPVCCRAPGEPPAEKLRLLLRPRHKVQETSRAHLPIPVPVPRELQRLRGPPAAEIQRISAQPPAARLLRYEDDRDDWDACEPTPKERQRASHQSHQPQGLIFPCFKSSRRLNPEEYPAKPSKAFAAVLPS